MRDTVVAAGNMVMGRMISGMLALSLDHPVVLCAILAGLAAASGAVLVDAVGKRT